MFNDYAEPTISPLAEFASRCKLDDVPKSVVEIQKALILDSVACAIAARGADVPLKELFAAAQTCSGLTVCEGAPLVSGNHAPAVAAYLNAGLIHALVFDPSSRAGAHLGTVALSPVLAIANFRQAPVSGADFLTATIVGCEVHNRLVRTARGTEKLGEAGWLDGQLTGVFGTAAGAGRAYDLTPDAMESAFGMAMMQAAGTREIIRGGDPPAKAFYGGQPNLSGVLAACLAASGVKASCDAVSGEHGILRGWFGRHDLASTTDGLGDYFVLDGSVNFSRWPGGSVLGQYVLAAQSLRAMDGFATSEIAAVRLWGPREESRWIYPFEERKAPTSAADAGHSVQYALACALVDGDLTAQHFSHAGIYKPEVRAVLRLMEVELVEDPRDTRIEVVLNSGTTLKTSVEVSPDIVGSLDPSKVVDKLHQCDRDSNNPLGEAIIDRICELVADLEELRDVAPLTKLLTER